MVLIRQAPHRTVEGAIATGQQINASVKAEAWQKTGCEKKSVFNNPLLPQLSAIHKEEVVLVMLPEMLNFHTPQYLNYTATQPVWYRAAGMPQQGCHGNIYFLPLFSSMILKSKW